MTTVIERVLQRTHPRKRIATEYWPEERTSIGEENHTNQANRGTHRADHVGMRYLLTKTVYTVILYIQLWKYKT